MRGLLLFALGWWFGRNPGATTQLVSAGQTLLDAQTGQPVTQTVLPDTTIISPEKANACKDGYTWWPQYGMCLSPAEDARAREAYKTGIQYTPR
jgi:hypothetical protein